MKRPTRNLTASIHQRLMNQRAGGEQLQPVLTRYAIERLLYRISRSAYADKFVLKGAMLLRAWGGAIHRPTTDLDLLGRRSSDIEDLQAVFRALCEIPVDEDGLQFRAETVRGRPIREQQTYGGIRIQLMAMLGTARI